MGRRSLSIRRWGQTAFLYLGLALVALAVLVQCSWDLAAYRYLLPVSGLDLVQASGSSVLAASPEEWVDQYHQDILLPMLLSYPHQPVRRREVPLLSLPFIAGLRLLSLHRPIVPARLRRSRKL